LDFQEAVRDWFDKYAEFNGRSARSAYWYWFLFALLAGLVGYILSAIVGTLIIYYLIDLALFLPGLAVGVRRLHDTNRSGWWILIAFIPLIGAIVLIVFFCQQSDAGENQYGPPPVAAPTAPAV
jgi:uncharacterized membrane protein YhaH (DUF805 family)